MKKLIPGLEATVNTIFCIGRNYKEHAKEMGHVAPSKPIVFLKPISSICYSGTEISLPIQSNEIHHEVEIVLAIGMEGKDIPENSALDYVMGYGIGIDFTARDLQKKAKEKGEPWSVAKGFDNFAPIGNFIHFNRKAFQELDFELSVNGRVKQHGNSSNMIFPPSKIISYLSSIFTLHKGDLIFTGTPEGVAQVHPGDTLKAEILNSPSKVTVLIS